MGMSPVTPPFTPPTPPHYPPREGPKELPRYRAGKLSLLIFAVLVLIIIVGYALLAAGVGT